MARKKLDNNSTDLIQFNWLLIYGVIFISTHKDYLLGNSITKLKVKSKIFPAWPTIQCGLIEWLEIDFIALIDGNSIHILKEGEVKEVVHTVLRYWAEMAQSQWLKANGSNLSWVNHHVCCFFNLLVFWLNKTIAELWSATGRSSQLSGKCVCGQSLHQTMVMTRTSTTVITNISRNLPLNTTYA